MPKISLTSAMSGASTVSLRNRLDVLTVENKQLKQRLEAAERDNRALKLSVYDLSARLNTALVRAGSHHSGLPPAPPNGDAPKGGKSDAAAAAISRSIDDSRLGVGGVRADLDELIEPPSSSSSAPTARFDSRHFEESCTLRGHGGAVYTVAFSPNGRLLASGSFDRSVRCWAVEGVQPQEKLCLDKHTHHVSSLSWSADSRSVLSGSFDHTIRWWDLDKGVSERLWHVPSSAFVQAVAHHPSTQSTFAVATTSNSLLLFDTRVAADKPTAELANGTMVNSMHFLPRGEHILTGDRHGAVRTWDLRRRRCVTCAYAGDARKPISHVTLSRPLPVSSAWVAAAGLPSASGVGAGSSTAAGLESSSIGALDRLLAVNSYDDTLRVFDSGFAPPLPPPSVHASVLLATGSADGDAYLYDVSGPRGTGNLLQRLRGHTDRVYAVEFHNELPLLASGSADFTIKLWAPQQQARRDERANRRRMGDS